VSSQPLEFKVRHIASTAIIDLQGQLDANASDALDSAYEQANHPGLQTLLLNFGGIEYINSTGIALLLGLIMQTSKEGCRLLACGLSAHYTKIFQMARLSEYIRLFPDEASALSSI
jgi:anti-anti-sigma factor